ncbi:double-stranded RNA-specific editase 1-like [Ostrinia furnacalis]|uniref:double-stranded RNA-specific editase 1-like n=1 Tax=Ostrinia furnacalis TaxID=93504 RepID=UPI00103FB2C6|nr:double-stranded RNA-specific editase 1-like [Ostrinia furnacalis]
MFARWQHVEKRLPLLPQDNNIGIDPVEMPEDMEHLLYNEAKQLCPTYQVAKQCLIDAFDKAKLGRWVKKPLEQDQFACEVADAPAHVLFA